MVTVSRRQFLKLSAAGLSASSLAILGFSPNQVLAEVRQYKTGTRHGDTQHLSVLLGRLRYSHVQPR